MIAVESRWADKMTQPLQWQCPVAFTTLSWRLGVEIDRGLFCSRRLVQEASQHMHSLVPKSCT